MYRTYHSLLKDERGQTLVLGAIGLLVIAMMAVSSASLSNAIYKKIKLQDAADAQAYSMAVKTARAFNLFAYLNRTMIINYAAMLTWMAYGSYVEYLMGVLTLPAQAAFFMNNFIRIPCCGFGALPHQLPTRIGVNAALITGAAVYTLALAGVSFLASAFLNYFCKWYSPALYVVPYISLSTVFLWFAQESMLQGTQRSLKSNSYNDTKALRYTFGQTSAVSENNQGSNKEQLFFGTHVASIKNAINNYNVAQAVSPIDDARRDLFNPSISGDESGMAQRSMLMNMSTTFLFWGSASSNTLSNPNIFKYRILMSNLVNGVRTRWTATGEWTPPILGIFPNPLGRMWDWKYPSIDFVARTAGGRIGISKRADTRMKSLANRNSFLGRDSIGDRISSYEQVGLYSQHQRYINVLFVGRVYIPLTLTGWSGPDRISLLEFPLANDVRVAADRRAGFHASINLMTALARDRPIQPTPTSHHFMFGVSPFMLSAPNFVDPHKYAFGQPDMFVVATKKMPFNSAFEFKTTANRQSVQELSSYSNKTFDTTWSGFRADLDTVLSRVQSHSDGLMAMSGARVMYHKPGDWKEQPNFFNPLWSARLSAINSNKVWQTPDPANISAMALSWAMSSEIAAKIALGSNFFNY